MPNTDTPVLYVNMRSKYKDPSSLV
jgi:hypothetical protein